MTESLKMCNVCQNNFPILILRARFIFGGKELLGRKLIRRKIVLEAGKYAGNMVRKIRWLGRKLFGLTK